MPAAEDQISDIQGRVRRFEEKLDKYLEIFVTKDLWNATTTRVQVDIANLELELKQHKKWAFEEHEKMRQHQDKALTDLTDAWEQLKDGLSRSQLRVRDFVISSLVSFLIGGGAIAVVSFFVTHH